MKNNLKIAIEAALMAGKEIMSVYSSKIKVEIKDDKSPLTEADSRANGVINHYLKNTEHPIISEENKLATYNQRKHWDTCWVVDPLDGTKEFIKKNGEFTVNIALIKNNKPILGVIYAPVLKTLYIGEVDKNQAYKIKVNSEDTSLEEIINNLIPIKPNDNSATNVKVVGSRSHMNDETKLFVQKLESQGKTTSIISKGSSLKFCLVADGSADIYPRFAPTMEWDTAAGQAICNAVGIEVISQATNKSLEYNKENLLNPWFLVGNL